MQKLKNKKLKIFLIAFVILILLFLYAIFRSREIPISYLSYQFLLDKNMIKEAKIVDNKIILYGNNSKIYSIAKEGIDIKELIKRVPIKIVTENEFLNSLLLIIAIFIMFLFFYNYIRKKNLEELKIRREEEDKRIKELKRDNINELPLMQKDTIKPAISNITFSDVVGIDEVKEELNEIVDFLKYPKKYRDFGISLPKGVLLVGPPGVGKTMVAKAVAGEANVPFFYQSGASFVQIYVGMGAKRVRDLFSHAKKYAPSIIFIDEIDAVGKRRGKRNEERESTLNQLLTEMDGFEDSSGVIVIGATNKIEVIDEALLRSGRFDRRIYLTFPDLNERKEIIRSYLKNKTYIVNIDKIAKMSVGFNGASLATLVNEAAINALRNNKRVIRDEDFFAVKDKVLIGKKKIITFLEEEKEIQATYQSAKAITAYWFEVDFDKINLVGGNDLKELDREIISKTQMVSKIKVYLSGYVASKLFYDEIYSNSKDDIKKVKFLIQEMVENGMGESIIPKQIEMENIINETIQELEKFLRQMKEKIVEIREILLKEEAISKEKIQKILKD